MECGDRVSVGRVGVVSAAGEQPTDAGRPVADGFFAGGMADCDHRWEVSEDSWQARGQLGLVADGDRRYAQARAVGVREVRGEPNGAAAVIKVAMIGAGSVVFSKNLTADILGCPEFRGATFSYMDVDRERLEVGAALCRKAARTLGAQPRIDSTLDVREALRGADFVINMVQVGGFDSTLVDFEIPRKYGLNFTIADTTGPGGLFRALRTYPMLTSLCTQMQELCPNALLLNYSNPMSMNMQTI